MKYTTRFTTATFALVSLVGGSQITAVLSAQSTDGVPGDGYNRGTTILETVSANGDIQSTTLPNHFTYSYSRDVPRQLVITIADTVFANGFDTP